MASSLKFTDIVPKLSNETIAAVHSFGFYQMTPVQAASIPLFLSNKDVLVEAVTGSGKTLAFGVPVFEILVRVGGSLKKHDVGAVIIAPTRELATQIFEVLNKISEHHVKFRCVLCVGGTPIADALLEYESVGGQILIGTPGRILDFYNRSQSLINFKTVEVLILDEADTLLDMGFKQSINDILHVLPKQRRTGLFSATQTQEVKELARAGMRNPVSITVRVQHHPTTVKSSESLSKETIKAVASAEPKLSTQTPSSSMLTGNRTQSTPTTLQNYYCIAEYDERSKHLLNFLLHHLNDKIIVFCSTCACVDFYGLMFKELSKHTELIKYVQSLSHVGSNSKMSQAFNVTTFHGRMVPKKRTALYKKFTSWSSGILFSTDVAARGIDIPDIDWIIQLTAPKDPSFFVHRVGRTARAGRCGGAVIFLTEEESAYIELLKGRGAPLQPYSFPIESNNTAVYPDIDILTEYKSYAKNDRTILETGSTAFISFLRAYKESLTSYIFRMEQLDIGAVARAYGLLRLPKIPETRGIKGGKPVIFEKSDVNTGDIPYRRKEQEQARIKRIELKKLSMENDEAAAIDDLNGVQDDKMSVRTSKTKKSWVPPEEYVPVEEKRKRKKKLSFTQKFFEEWDDLAADETAFKKFKKGKLSKKEYGKQLLGLTDKSRKNDDMDAGDGDDDDSDD